MKEILVITVVGLLSLLIGYSLAGFVVLSLFYNILDSTITWMPFVKITICGALAIAGIMGLVGFHGYLFKKAKMSSAGPGGKATFDSAISELDFSQEWFEHIETWIKLSKSKMEQSDWKIKVWERSNEIDKIDKLIISKAEYYDAKGKLEYFKELRDLKLALAPVSTDKES